MSPVNTVLSLDDDHGRQHGERTLLGRTPWMTSLKTLSYRPIVRRVRPEMRGHPWRHASCSPRRACSSCLTTPHVAGEHRALAGCRPWCSHRSPRVTSLKSVLSGRVLRGVRAEMRGRHL